MISMCFFAEEEGERKKYMNLDHASTFRGFSDHNSLNSNDIYPVEAIPIVSTLLPLIFRKGGG